MQFIHNGTTIIQHYALHDAEPMRDNVRAEFIPGSAEVKFHDGRARYVWLRGLRTKSGVRSYGGYSIDDGVVQPDDRNGPAPQWVTDLVQAAIEEARRG